MSMDNTIKDVSEATQFLNDTFYQAHLNINPDLGFLKADGSSAFESVSDEIAQTAQIRLVECETILRNMGIDIWEICMDLSMTYTMIEFAKAINPTEDMLYDADWLEMLTNRHKSGLMAHTINGMKEEDSERIRLRRDSFIIKTCEELQSTHPLLKDIPETWKVGNTHKATMLCASLMPVGWEELLSNLVTAQGGIDYQTSLDPTDVEDIQSFVDDVNTQFNEINEIDPDSDENDDDPFGGL